MLNVIIVDVPPKRSLEPLSCSLRLQDIPVAGISIGDRLRWFFGSDKAGEGTVRIREDFWPCSRMLKEIIATDHNLIIHDADGSELLNLQRPGAEETRKTVPESGCFVINYPWEILAINEKLVEGLDHDRVEGLVRDGATIEGNIVLGRGSVILPGVYIEGNAVIGANCKIGPNCYIRGNTYIGDNCHIGQAVEIKNSMLMNKVSIGHLSYLGDSIICGNTNFGAGTITANLRHDGKNHRTEVCGKLLDTGRRKFGTVVGAGVHTGIHTSIYPGRKIWPEMSTRPGAIVSKDIKPE